MHHNLALHKPPVLRDVDVNVQSPRFVVGLEDITGDGEGVAGDEEHVGVVQVHRVLLAGPELDVQWGGGDPLPSAGAVQDVTPAAQQL